MPNSFSPRLAVAASCLGAAVLALSACADGPVSPAARPLSPTAPSLSLLAAPAGTLANAPVAPQQTVNTTYVPSTGRVVLVEPTQSLQAAIDTARPGDVITLRAGRTYTGNFTLRPKTGGTDWVTIRTSTPDALLPAGVRVTPAKAPLLAKIVTPNALAAIATADFASRYRLIGLEVTTESSVSINYGIVQLGDNTLAQNTLAEIPSDIILDRTYVHGVGRNNVKRCVALNGKSQAVIDSYLSECHHAAQDAQAINGTNGPGPFRIENNYLEASGEVIMFGGADPAIANLIPSDIEVRRNLLTRPVSWKGMYAVKNLFELKNAQRVVVEDNVMENNWASGQVGFAVVITPVNDGGTCTWCVVRDLSFTRNVVRRSPNGINISATNSGSRPSGKATRLRFADNVISQLDTLEFTGAHRVFQLLNDLSDVSIDHNTVIGEPNVFILMDGVTPMVRMNIINNIGPTGEYGIFGSGSQEGSASIEKYMPGAWVARNVFVGASASRYPAGNYFPAMESAVGYVNLLGGNFTLSLSSPFLGTATDGDDAGARTDGHGTSGSALAQVGPLTSGLNSGCLSVPGRDPSTTTYLIVSDCVSGAPYQTWTAPATGQSGRITLPSGYCLAAGSAVASSSVNSAPCGTQTVETWTYTWSSEIRTQNNPNLCVTAQTMYWGVKVALATCDGSASQRWTLD